MTDEDSSLGDFEAHDSEAATEEQQPFSVPHLRNSRSEHDRTIRPGDVVRDLWGNGWLIAYRKKADSVAEYDKMQDDTKPSLLSYEGSIGMGATEDDAVWACFYVNQNNTLAGGRSGPYDFPESRICRYAYEATDGFKKPRFQHNLRVNTLEQVVGAVLRSGNETLAEQMQDLLADAFDPETAQEAWELAESARGDPGA